MMHNEIPLSELEILIVDCQATGANPDKGHLLEIGWISGSAGASSAPPVSAVQSCLIQLPVPGTIPIAVQRLTGISDTEMEGAVTSKTAWDRLKAAAQTNASANRSHHCTAVIHYARFETPFMRQLHAAHDPETPFPFHIICTHAIAKKLLPGLPRKGIRAIAGYFGHWMPEFKRSADHVLATLMIWKNLVQLLQTRFAIENLQQLAGWLTEYRVPGRTRRAYPMNPNVRLSLPDKPGVYRMRPAGGGILYIGKAKSLKQRVNSYFRGRAGHPEHILEMLSQARDIDFTVTGSALEAAVLESDEIKRRRPPYNRALRPDRRGLVFFARDLKERSTRSNHNHPIGPLPEGRLLDALQAFQAWLSCGTPSQDEELVRMANRILPPLTYREPPFQILQEGFDLFRSNHRTALQRRSTLRIVTAIGAQLWRRRLDDATCIDADADSESESDTGAGKENEADTDRRDWSPENIADAIESILMHSAYLIRRARWYCLLSESCLAWASERNPDELQNLVVFEGGGSATFGVLPGGRNLPAPPGGSRSWPERRRNLDLVAYDRMRVVTTELRRLASLGRRLELCLGTNARLTLSEVQRALRWV